MTVRAYRKPGRGTLMILALLLAGSAALRTGAGVGEAMALTPDVAGDAGATAPLDCPAPPAALAKALVARDAQLTAREAALADRMAALTLADEVVTGRLAALQQAEADLSATLALADGAAEADLVRLTAVYEAMKPKDAASLFGTMEPEFAAGFLGRMQPEVAAAVLSKMPADAAYAISAIVAGRNAGVPQD